jgi:hypothetical protein
MAIGAGLARVARPNKKPALESAGKWQWNPIKAVSSIAGAGSRHNMITIIDWLNTQIIVAYSIIFLVFFVGVFVGVIISENRRR